jgi:tripartite-type tricarboxylate transporter receptor subunit TctC
MYKTVLSRMKFALGLVAASSIAFTSPSIQAQSWPDKPVKLVIPFAAGGTTDILGRLLAQQFSSQIPCGWVYHHVGFGQYVDRKSLSL